MSIASCPRCSRAVGVPADVGQLAIVRCPCCSAEFPFAEALANLPPLLEMVSSGQADPMDWLADDEPRSTESEQVATEADFLEESSGAQSPIEADSLGSDFGSTAQVEDASKLDEIDFGGDLDEVELSNEEQDTEVEEFDFQAEGTLIRDVPADHDPLEIAGPEFDLETAADEPAFDFSAEEATEVGEEIEFDASHPAEAATSGEETYFVRPVTDAPPEDEIELDFGQPDAPAPVNAAQQDAAGASDVAAGKKKKKKEKKSKPPKVKAASSPGGRRSLAGTLLGALVVLIVVPVITIYALLWLGKDGDFFHVARYVPNVLLPPAFKPAPRAIVLAQASRTQTPAQATESAPETAPPKPDGAAENAGSGEESAVPPAEEKTPPAADPAASDEPTAQPPEELPPDDEPPAAETSPPESAASAPIVEQTPDEAMPDEAVGATSEAPDSEAPDSDISDAPPAPPAEEAPPAGLPQARHYTTTDLAKAIEDASGAERKMAAEQASASRAQVTKLRRDLYLALFGLAEIATFAKDDPAQPQLAAQQQAVQQALLALAADPKRLAELKRYGAGWLQIASRTTPGIVLVGVVEKVEPAGKLHQIELKAGSADKPVTATVVTDHDPQLAPGDEILTLGSIVDQADGQPNDPQDNAGGVVWSGMTLKLSAEK